MSNHQPSGAEYFVIIADQKKKNKYLELLGRYGVKGIQVIYGHGSASPSVLKAAFGLEVEQHKVIITCLLKKENAAKLIDVLYKEYHFNKPNTGIAFGIAVEGLAF